MSISGFRRMYHIAGHKYETAEGVAEDYDSWWKTWAILGDRQPLRVAAELYSLRFPLPPSEQQDLIDSLVTVTENRAEREEARRRERLEG